MRREARDARRRTRKHKPPPRVRLCLVSCLLFLPLPGCGFHLRGTADARLPAALSVMRIVVQDSPSASDPLLIAMKNALQIQAGVKVVAVPSPEAKTAPVLILRGERISTETLSVRTTTVKASEYLLKYEVSFSLNDALGREVLAPQTVRLRRDYTFDPTSVLAKEKEETELRREMRQDAVQQILRRLQKVSLS